MIQNKNYKYKREMPETVKQKISVILSLEIIAMYFVKLICGDIKFTKHVAICLIINNLISSN